MQKLGIKDNLPGLLAIPFFFQSSAVCVRLAFSYVACLSLFSSLLFPFFFVLLSFSWKLVLRRTKTTGAAFRDIESDGHATPVLVFVCFLSFCWCFLWRWRRWWRWRCVVMVELSPLPLCFPCFQQCRSYGFLCPASLSFLLIFLFSFFLCSLLSFYAPLLGH